MKFIKTFENHNSEMSREEMCDMLCSMGYEMNELEVCSDSELADICRNVQDMRMSNESNMMSREEMCDMLCSMGYEMSELEVCSDSELSDICRNAEKMGMFPMPSNESKSASRKFRQLNLSKTLKEIKEHQENENYMFFANVENICRMCREILDMDKSKVDRILSNGHGWAVDHVATSKDDMEEVYGFLKTHSHDSIEPSFDETEGQLAKKELESEIKSFNNFK